MKPDQSRVVYLCAGKDGDASTPTMRALIETAVSKEFRVEIPNFKDVPNPEDRVKWLLKSDAWEAGCLVLAGVSMGGYVAAVGAPTQPARGLLLVAPPL
jgi:hypothetical protein